MKGHTIFELTNTETGEKRVYKDDNMVTNFLEQFCIPTGKLNYNLNAMFASYESQKTLTQPSNCELDIEPPHCFTQGLLLFEDEIDEDADNIWPRNGNKMIGQAGNSSYSGANTKAGSYNSAESGPVENGYRYVWDFATSQANGQISCACLTTPWGAVLGTGNTELFSDYTDYSYIFLSDYSQRSNSSQSGLTTEGIPCLIDYDKKCSYQLKGICKSSGTGIAQDILEANSCFIKKEIRVRREKILFDEISIFDKVSKSIPAINFEDLVFPMPQDIIDSCDYDAIFTKEKMYNKNFNIDAHINSWGKHIYIYFTLAGITINNCLSLRNINAGDDIIIIDIDTEAETCTTFKVRNTTGSYIKVSTGDSWSAYSYCTGKEDDPGYYTTSRSSCTSPIFITDKYVLMHTEDGKIYRISRADNTDVKAFTLEGSEDEVNFGAHYSKPSYRFSFLPLGKDIIQFNKNKVLGFRNSNNEMYMFDFENVTLGRLSKNANDYAIFRYGAIKILGTDLFVKSESNNSSSLCGGTFPVFLSTINNLDSPVLKTSADTMKVTYIITNGDV